MPAVVENCSQNMALAVIAEENEEKYQLRGHRLSINES